MKQKLFTLCLTLTAMCASTMAQVEINETNFPDARFREFVSQNSIDTNGDGILSQAELNAVTVLEVCNKGIKDLTGIQYFTKLVTLRCWGNDISGMNMFKLINSLPENKSSNYVIVVNHSGSNPDNFMTKGQVALAQSRGWYPYIYTYEEEEDPYDGEDLTITANFFPDENFRNYLLAQNYGQDGILSVTELDNLITLDVPDMGIVTLKGIEHFTNLMFFTCHSNSLASLDLSQNTKLVNLHCSSNSLTSLDLSHNKSLLALYCGENNLETLDLSQNTELGTLACPLNKLTSLDVSSCPNLGYLSCDGNNITGDAMTTLVNSLPERTTASEFFVCSDKCSPDNTITTAQAKVAKDKKWTVKKETASGWVEYAGFDPIAINATNFPDEKFRAIVKDKAINTNEDDYLSEEEVKAVTDLDLTTKEIGKLDGIGFFTELTRLICQANFLNKLDVTKNTKLKILNCQMNALSVLDLSQNKALTTLSCGFNGMSALDLSNNTALTGVSCEGNKIKGESMTTLVNSLPAVEEGVLYVVDDHSNTDNTITTAQATVAKNKGWTVKKYNGAWQPEEYAGFDPIAIDATNFPDEKFLAIVKDKAINTNEDNYLSEKEVIAVTVMNVSNKGISNLKGIEYFTALKSLNCYINGLKSLDVSKNTALEVLSCWGCHLENLDVSKNTALTRLDCCHNSLTSLDVSTNTKLMGLRCYCNQISGADMTKLVNSLPSLPSGENGDLTVSNDMYVPDNVITAAQVKIATDKGWTVKKVDNDNKLLVYAGQGDVNGDNKINQDDRTLTVNIIMGQKPTSVGEYAGDLNKNGKTDAADIVLMNNILNGK